MACFFWLPFLLYAVKKGTFDHRTWRRAILRIGATIPMLLVLTQPFTVFSLSHVLFGERLTGLQLLSGVLLLVGSALAIWTQQHLRRVAAIRL